MRKINLLSFAFIFLLSFCSQPNNQPDSVKVRLAIEPETLSPINYGDAGALQIVNLLYQSLLGADLGKDQISPVLAARMPEVIKTDSTTLFTYEIREGATWTNGSPVTAADVAFTLKVLNAPLLNNERLKPQVEFIKDIVPDEANPKKFTFVCKGYAPEMELLTGDFFILPAYLIDPQGLLKDYKLSALQDDLSKLENKTNLETFASRFNGPDFNRSKDLLQGSGGYLIENWVSGQSITLRRKENWWGSALDVDYITANPEQISFYVIPDNTTALFAIKNRQLDVLEKIDAAEFNQLREDKAFTKDYALYTPNSYEFAYVGLNSRLPKFEDKRTRQAIAHLLDVNSLIKASQQNYATPTVGPVPPSLTDFYNTSLKPIDFSLAKARKLLEAAGWQHTSEGWFKVLDGQKTKLTIDVNYRAGNTAFENASLIFQQNAAKADIPVTIQAMEGSLFGQKSKAHEFEMFFRTLSGNPFVLNFKPLFHTSFSGIGGMNYTGFGNSNSDELLDAINSASTKEEKARLLKELQRILYDEATFISLYYHKDKLAVHRRFKNIKISGLSPNYDVSSFTLKD
ncbi:ABC transporter substrate-binding protein [Pontibacter sp. MBLB2868]|uniref:ABC transporter substrate-binding protein n=1 Tax=Pontibacter sp. MBLB2868 TaxID=3451555 RepID=UPI003F74B8B2